MNGALHDVVAGGAPIDCRCLRAGSRGHSGGRVTASVTAAGLRSCWRQGRAWGLLPGGWLMPGVTDGSGSGLEELSAASRAPARVRAVLAECPDSCGL